MHRTKTTEHCIPGKRGAFKVNVRVFVQEVTIFQKCYADVEVNKFNTIRKYYSDFMAIMTQILFIFMPVACHYALNQNTIFIPSANSYL